ncbi:ADP-ribosylglycohydrolase family protein [Providencia rettgeri]|uniref:ADP-ribosylglycohydrolase family protein n=1 Tax=Providencia TaxID=586 RepID=UPI001BD4C03C|nr:ADP-ribosylglycohydrolase family protein [Providencia rettgeri]ELR5070357.1 ADP-ribosylglycohydrolase family protein [Providencia rettgeri]ELR5222251.1 ADP-ribosylglycohydrolase family protein [Providencia rettgeri]MDX7322187.1 ADP-ribosylglycohydrolase family protein [Providencia rettgeri]
MQLTQKVIYNKIYGSLAAAGMGDALGAPTELYSIDEIIAAHRGFLDHFITPPKDTFAGSLNGVAGLITDDSSQMYVLSEGLISAGYNRFTNQDWVNCLLRWADMQPYANYKGPTTELIVNALKSGQATNTIGRIGTSERQAPNIGTTNGAGMRIAPAGLIYPGQLDKACELAALTCIPSHDTNIAIASACAIAAGVSQAMMVSATVESVVEACLYGARYGEVLAKKIGRVVAGPNIEMRIQLALRIARENTDLEICLRQLEGYVGNSVAAHESIPTAIGLFAFTKGQVWDGIVAATNVGNDTDSIATMVGAMAGALQGFDSLPQDQYQFFSKVNSHDFDIPKIAQGLSELAWQALQGEAQ